METKQLNLRESVVRKSILFCPHCHERCLLFQGGAIFQRKDWDSPVGLYCNVSPSCVALIDLDAEDNNPSEKGSGARIEFVCEACKKHSYLAIAEGKGEIFIYWELDPKEVVTHEQKK